MLRRHVLRPEIGGRRGRRVWQGMPVLISESRPGLSHCADSVMLEVAMVTFSCRLRGEDQVPHQLATPVAAGRGDQRSSFQMDWPILFKKADVFRGNKSY